jgi:exoribonuclease R
LQSPYRETATAIESDILLHNILRPLDLFADFKGTGSYELLLREIGVMTRYDDPSFNQMYNYGIFDNETMELINGEMTCKRAKSLAEKLVSEGMYTYSKGAAGEKTKTTIPGRKLVSPAKNIRNTKANQNLPAFSTEFHNRDPLANLRIDRGSLTVYAIDSEDAHEIDDGISLEETPDGNWIHVHIADPTSYIPNDNYLIKLARERACSIYLPHNYFPMLPNFIAGNLLDLGVSSSVLTFSAKLSDYGEILDFQIQPSFVSKVHRVSYDDADAILDSSKLNSNRPTYMKNPNEITAKQKLIRLSKEDQNVLKKLQQITWNLREKRIQNGALVQEQLDINISMTDQPYELSPMKPSKSFHGKKFDRKGTLKIDPYLYPHRSPSHVMVEEAMILAGRVAAKYCLERNINVPFRNQKSPFQVFEKETTTFDKLTTAFQKCLDERDKISGITPLNAVKELIPFMQPAMMSTVSDNHFSLGIKENSEFSGYLHVTSPLRRFQDMITHYQIGSSMLGLKPVYTSEEIELLIKDLHRVSRRNSMLAKRSNKYWMLEYIKRKSISGEPGFTATDVGDSYRYEFDGNPKVIFEGIAVVKQFNGNSETYVMVPELCGLTKPCIAKRSVENGQILMVTTDTVFPLYDKCVFREIS